MLCHTTGEDGIVEVVKSCSTMVPNGAGDGTEEERLQVKYDCCGICSNIRVSSEAEGYGKYNAPND